MTIARNAGTVRDDEPAVSITASVAPLVTDRRPALQLVPERAGDDVVDAGALADAEALAPESLCLRRRAEREAAALDHGSAHPDRARVTEIVRAFRAYRPFVFDRDRALNDAAHRRVVASFRAARDGHPSVVSA